MKHTIVEVKNVVRTQVMFENLQTRSMITPGIGLIHGPSGYGKTTTVTHMFNELTLTGHQPLYVRCYATDSPSSFLARVMGELGAEPMYPLRKMVDYIVRSMNENSLALFVDEADHIVGQAKTMETIRDLYDSTEQPVVLIGMEEIARRISHRKQLFNRISEWVEFQAADLEDVHMFAQTLLDKRVQVGEDMLEYIRTKSSGEVRRILIALEKIERAAIASDEHFIDLDAWGDRPLFLSHRR
ncbi:ATP-binding protein [Alishewanella sp. BS5-314]|uniref:AAA family ATPase n=1 Tax=Alishewanella sp. BS5-314 TaxID=2755587 RepID=UPI0021BA7EE0|nr:ATP-binding protein [Alishewanella sp. BS5-314]MCT8125300.1 ATP-binding protein [Alishewanella sp. BS5-314]